MQHWSSLEVLNQCIANKYNRLQYHENGMEVLDPSVFVQTNQRTKY